MTLVPADSKFRSVVAESALIRGRRSFGCGSRIQKNYNFQIINYKSCDLGAGCNFFGKRRSGRYNRHSAPHEKA